MKRFFSFLIFTALLLSGCGRQQPPAQVAATTMPVYDFTARLCQGTPISVTRLVTEQVSCLHDYALNVRQVKAAEAAQVIVISGAGLEEFMEDLLQPDKTIDASRDVALLCGEDAHEEEHEGHHHAEDPHIWLSPENAKIMAANICAGLTEQFPEYSEIFQENLLPLLADLDKLQAYGEETLKNLSCRELVTFHDGFAYLADAFDLHILRAVEEESGSEASARELIDLITLVEGHRLPAIFTERNGSTSAAQVISRETGAGSFSLDMAMGDGTYLDAMYHNLDTLKEALQ